MHNAIVHNVPEGDDRTVRVTTGGTADTVHVIVDNTGPQLTPALVATLVEPFRRATDRVRDDHGGVGLGLAIVRSIALAHHGTLTLQPRDGGGLHAEVRLPAATAPAEHR